MKRTIIITTIFCVILFGLVVFKSRDNQYQVYIPHVFNGDKIVGVPDMLTKRHKQNAITVLRYYNEDWKLEKGKLLVSKKIDRELLLNYTKKANDSIWLLQHKPGN
ncbi:MAG: hypothetical protein EOO44_15575 [Flavobacterium sp.]|nr:MAG: hypothetical protein EOO44_15575 [Flavobacterium sp.]